MKEIKVVLKRDREKPIQGRHPWIFSGAIDLIEDGFEAGDIVRVHSASGQFLGKGYVNPRSEIAVRMLTFEDEEIGAEFFRKRVESALRLRETFLASGTDAYRLVNSEGDFLPGLIIDKYAGYLVVQVLTAGMEKFQPHWLEALRQLVKVRGIYAKDDSDSRQLEGLEDRLQLLWGEEPPDFIPIEEHGVKFLVDVRGGQKTGFFLDQRENRAWIRRLAGGKRVLNAFSYTGGFSVYCALGEAERVVSIDSSETAMNTARLNFEKNGIDISRHAFLTEDVFDYLRKTGEEFDLIILDPPAFAKSRNQVIPASRGYKDINLWAMKRLQAGGFLFTSSCSSHVPADLFQKIVFGAAKDARRQVQITGRSAHPFDHPVSIFHPEGEYLKSLLCRVL